MGAICGFVGVGSPGLCDAMLERLRHRGTERDAATLAAGGALGVCAWPPARRAAGAPRAPGGVGTSADGTVRCVVDGRLFAPRELGAALVARGLAHPAGEGWSDAELLANLLMLDGDEALDRVDGAFVAALSSPAGLWLVRDALGEKPLYYAPDVAGTLLFASEVKALLAHPAFCVEPDLDSLHKLLVFSFVPGEGTLFRGVRQLEPGRLLHVAEQPSGRTLRQRPTFELRERLDPLEDEATSVARVAEVARAAVRKRLPADGSVAAFLSGGIDSSAVVALLAELGAKPLCFSVAFGQGTSDDLGYARMVTEHCGLEHRVIPVEPESFLGELETIIYGLDDPLCDCIVAPNYLLAREAAKHATVVFNGEGGDPLFGGPKNKFMILAEWYRFLEGYDPARIYLGSYHKLYEHLGALLTPELAAAGGGSAALEAVVRPYLEDPRMPSFLNRLMHMNVKLKGGQNILVKVDKMLSAHGVEAASPLFDRELTELAFAVPPRLKRRGDVEKYVFKRAFEGQLPRAVVYRKKLGMGVPLNHWFRKTVLRDYASDLLLSERARARGYFRPEVVQQLLRGQDLTGAIGQDRSGEHLWMLLAIEIWHRVYVDRGGHVG
jgi:asparagine synthase (glutamine-hydrolysing)